MYFVFYVGFICKGYERKRECVCVKTQDNWRLKQFSQVACE